MCFTVNTLLAWSMETISALMVFIVTAGFSAFAASPSGRGVFAAGSGAVAAGAAGLADWARLDPTSTGMVANATTRDRIFFIAHSSCIRTVLGHRDRSSGSARQTGGYEPRVR